MKLFIILSLAVATLAMPGDYGYGYGKIEERISQIAPIQKTEVRIAQAALPEVKSYGYEAPPPEVRKAVYQAPPPEVRQPIYQAPAPVVRQPVIEATPAPLRVNIAYEAPKAAPAPVYEAPKAAPYGGYEAPRVAPPAPAYGGYEAPSAPLREAPKVIPILKHVREDDTRGNTRLQVETGHGIVHTEQGSLKDLNLKEGPVHVRTGQYSYTGPDGKKYTVQWTADEKGFHATGEHLPTPPPVPEDIKKSLALPRVPEHLQAGPLGEGEAEILRPQAPAAPVAPAASVYGGYGEEKAAVRAPPPAALPVRSRY